jgi:DNA topoisomerase-3
LLLLVRNMLLKSKPAMSKSLVIAEKPSVAADLAKVLGVKKMEDHFEDDRYVISSAVGHLVELCLPSELDVKRGKWSFANLPIIPDEFELKPIENENPLQSSQAPDSSHRCR